MVWVALFRAPLPCEKRKPKYTSCVLKSTLPYKTPRQTQTPTVVATPQLLRSRPCQIKGTCSTPTPKCTSELLLFSPDATVTRNRSTRNKDGTQPRHTSGQHSPQTKGGNCFTCPRWHCSLVLFRTSWHHSLEPMSELGNSIPGFQWTTFLQRLSKQFQTAMTFKSPSLKNVRNISKSSQVKLVLIQTQVTS